MPIRIFVLCVVYVFNVNTVYAKQYVGVDEVAQLPYVEWRNDVMSLRLVQRLPDQTRAYFAGRGFNKKDTEFIAGYCIFQSVYTNLVKQKNGTVIDYDISTWRILHKGKSLKLLIRQDWQKIWKQRKAKPAQAIAFKWSLLPPKQSLTPADYNWGMTVYPVAHGESFDLQIYWQENGKEKSALMKGLQCAKDIYIPPSEAQ